MANKVSCMPNRKIYFCDYAQVKNNDFETN